MENDLKNLPSNDEEEDLQNEHSNPFLSDGRSVRTESEIYESTDQQYISSFTSNHSNETFSGLEEQTKSKPSKIREGVVNFFKKFKGNNTLVDGTKEFFTKFNPNFEGSYLNGGSSLLRTVIIIALFALVGLYVLNMEGDFSDEITLLDDPAQDGDFNFLPDETDPSDGQLSDLFEDTPIENVGEIVGDVVDKVTDVADNVVENIPDGVKETIVDVMPDMPSEGIPEENFDVVENQNTGGAGAPTLSSPPNGSSRVFDDTMQPTEFVWSGSSGGQLLLSKSSSMSPVASRYSVNGNSTRIRTLLPGNWYWQITNSEGKSPVWSFTIENPIPRNISLVQPNSGSKVSGSGGIVTWTGDSKVSFYKVQISSGGNWNNPEYSFSTVGTQLSINGVSAGSYSLRIGAFSEVSGKWEYTSPVSVSIQ